MGKLDLIPLVPIAARPHPFRQQRIDCTAPAYQDLRTMLWTQPGLPPALWSHAGTRVWVNDELVSVERMHLVVLRPGDLVTVAATPTDDGDKVLRTVLMIGIMILSIWTQQYYGVWAGAAVMFGGGLLVNALVPVQDPKINNAMKRDGPTYSVTGTRNEADPYGPLPRVYGLHRVYPRYAALPYTELVGDDQYLRCLFVIGKGRYALSEHKIGETALSGYDEIKHQVYYTGETNTFNLFPQSVYEDTLSIELTAALGWQTRSTQTNTDEISIDLTFPLGIYFIGSDGDRDPSECNFEIAYAPYGTTDWISYSETQTLVFELYAEAGPNVGDTISGGTSGATGVIRRIWMKQEYNPTGGYDEWGNPLEEYINYLYSVRVELDDSEVLFESGEVVTIDGTWDATVETARSGAVVVRRNQTSQLRYGITIDVPNGQWTVRIRRTTGEDDQHIRASYWTALRSITHGAPVTADNVTLVALRVKATGQLNGVIDQYNCMAQALVHSYSGSAWNLVSSRNPAWAFCDVLRGESNARPLADSALNLTAIRTWAGNCNTAGRTYSAVIDYRSTVWGMAKAIAAVGRASPGLVDGLVTVVEDKVQTTPVQHFSPRNSWGFSGSKAFADLPHALKVRFFNADADYVQDERVVYDDGYDSGSATRFEAVDLLGATDPDQVWKWGRYMIACGRLRPEAYSFNADVENIVCTRGDLVRLTHDVLSVGLGQGRIKSLTTSGSNVATITVDDAFPMETGSSYGIRIRKSDGSSVTATVATVNGDNTVLTLTSTLASSGIAAGDLVLYGLAGLESIEALVQRIEPGPELTARITCVPYNSAILTADSGTIPAWTSNITLPPARNRTPTQPLIRSTHYDFHATRLNDDGSKAIVLTLTWDLMSPGSTFSRIAGAIVGSVVDTTIAGFEVQYRIEDDDWVSLNNRPSSARRVNIIVQEDYSYDFRIRSFNASGMTSAWDTETDVVVDLVYTAPTAPTDLQVRGGGTSWTTLGCPIEWTAPSSEGPYGLRIRDYKVMVYDGSDNLRRTRYVTDTTYVYRYTSNVQDGAGTPVGTLKFRVYTRDVWGHLSATYASLTATHPDPTAPQTLYVERMVGGVKFEWDENTETSFQCFLYRIKVNAGSWSSWRRTIKSQYIYITPAGSGTSPRIYIEVKTRNFFGQTSSTESEDNTVVAIEDALPVNTSGNLILNSGGEDYRDDDTSLPRNWYHPDAAALERITTGGNLSNAYIKLTRTSGMDSAGSDSAFYSIDSGTTKANYISYSKSGGYPYASLLVFQVDIGQGETVPDVYIRMRCSTAATGIASVKTEWSAVDYDDYGSSCPDQTTFRYTDYPNKTTSKVVTYYTLSDFVAGEYYDTPNLKTIIQEIVDRPGWVTGNYIGLIVDTTGSTGDNFTIIFNSENDSPAVYTQTLIFYTDELGNVQVENAVADGEENWIEVLTSDYYQFGGDIKTQGGGVVGKITLLQYDQDKNNIGSATLSETGTSWTAKSARIQISSQTRFLLVALQCIEENGWAAFDNLFLYRVGGMINNYGVWKAFYSNGSGILTELALGASGRALIAQGATSAPIFGTLASMVAANNWRVFYSNGSAALTELALGAAGTLLLSNGASSAPSFVNLTSVKSANNWRLFHSNGSAQVTELAIGETGQVVRSAGTAAAPEFATAETLLASVTVNLQNGDGKTTIYTVPTGKKLIVTRVVIRGPSGDMAGGTDFDFGDGANADTWKTAVDLSALGTAQYRIITNNDTNITIFDAADVFGVLPVTGATADVTATAELFGYLYNA